MGDPSPVDEPGANHGASAGSGTMAEPSMAVLSSGSATGDVGGVVVVDPSPVAEPGADHVAAAGSGTTAEPSVAAASSGSATGEAAHLATAASHEAVASQPELPFRRGGKV